MRRVRRIAVIGAAMAMMMGAGVGVASAKANGSAELANGTELAFHASGTPSKNSGGFESYGSPLGYFSGNVSCYTQSGNTAAFTSTIRKATDKSLIGQPITFWVVDGTTDQFGYQLGATTCTGPARNLQNVTEGYITIK
jgi:hypothetical protein